VPGYRQPSARRGTAVPPKLQAGVLPHARVTSWTSTSRTTCSGRGRSRPANRSALDQPSLSVRLTWRPRPRHQTQHPRTRRRPDREQADAGTHVHHAAHQPHDREWAQESNLGSGASPATDCLELGVEGPVACSRTTTVSDSGEVAPSSSLGGERDRPLTGPPITRASRPGPRRHRRCHRRSCPRLVGDVAVTVVGVGDERHLSSHSALETSLQRVRSSS
jgi:hypothetical protein